MTVIIGTLCKDGIVIGADSAATSAAGSYRTVEMPTRKLCCVADNQVLIGGTGSVGLGQRFAALVQKYWNEKSTELTEIEIAKSICNLTRQDFASTGAKIGEYGACIGFVNNGNFHYANFLLMIFNRNLRNHIYGMYLWGADKSLLTRFSFSSER